MGLMIWVVIGLIVSVLTLAIEPYVIRRHIPVTILIGIIGAVVGGAIGSFLGFGAVEGMRFMIMVLACAGSVFLLTCYREIEQA